MYKQIATFFGCNGHGNVFVSSSESSGFFICIDSCLHTKLTNFAAFLSVSKYPKNSCLLPIRRFATHGFFVDLLIFVTPTYFDEPSFLWEDFTLNQTYCLRKKSAILVVKKMEENYSF